MTWTVRETYDDGTHADIGRYASEKLANLNACIRAFAIPNVTFTVIPGDPYVDR